MGSLDLPRRFHPGVGRRESIFWEATAAKLIPPGNPGGNSQTVSSVFIIGVLRLMLSEEDKTIHNGDVNKVVEQGLPPFHALPQTVIGCQDLIRTVHSIHVHIVPADDTWLRDISPENVVCFSPPS